MKIINIYHSVDLDGWMSAGIVKLWWEKQPVETINGEYKRNEIDFIGYNYGDPIPDLSKYDKVIMCDISFPKDIMRELRRDKFNYVTGEDNLIFIDHHLSAINDSKLEFYDTCAGIRDTKFAACELTWDYFFPNETIPEIVRLLGRYDCFGSKGTDEHTKVLEFQYGARAFIKNYEDAYSMLLEELTERTSSIVDRLHMQGIAIYEYLCTEAKQTYKNGFEINIGQSNTKLVDIATLPNLEEETLKNAQGAYLPFKFICINKERFNPINFGIDYHKDGYDGCACFHYANEMWNFSLYNDNGKVDCSAIAKQYLGGGHFSASGFRIKDITQIIK